MPKTKKVTVKRKSLVQKPNIVKTSKIKWGESYTSLLLGVIVVIVGFLLILSFLQNRNYNKTKATSSSSITNEKNNRLPKSYSVKDGEDLWTISQKIYGSGYNWVDLAKANNLTDPGIIYKDTRLIVPDVKEKVAVKKNISESENVNQTSNSIPGKSYVIQKGDFLWEIAIRAYGDGYRWVDIAKANNLTDPDLIFSGNVLTIPR